MTEISLGQVVANCYASITIIAGKIDDAKAQNRPIDVLKTNVANALNNAIFPPMLAEIDQCKDKLGEPSPEADALKQIEKLIREAVQPEKALWTVTRVRAIAALPLELNARIAGIALAKEVYASCGIMVANDGREYNIAAGASFPDQNKSVVLLSPPDMQITDDKGGMAPTTPLLWSPRLVVLSIDNATNQIEISSAPSVSGKFISGQQTITFTPRTSPTSPPSIEMSGEGQVTNAWILSEATTPNASKLFTGRADLVTGRVVSYANSFGSNPAICEAKGAETLRSTATSLSAAA